MENRLVLEMIIGEDGEVESSLTLRECVGDVIMSSHHIPFDLATIQVGNAPSSMTIILKNDIDSIELKSMLESLGARVALMPVEDERVI